MPLIAAAKLLNLSFPNSQKMLLFCIDKKLLQKANSIGRPDTRLNEYMYAKENLPAHASSTRHFLLRLSRSLFPFIFKKAQLYVQRYITRIRTQEQQHRDEIIEKIRILLTEKVKIVVQQYNKLQLVIVCEIQPQRLCLRPSFTTVFLPPPFRPDTYCMQLSKTYWEMRQDQALRIRDVNDNPVLDLTVSWYLSRVLLPDITNIVLEYWFTSNCLRIKHTF